MDEEPKAMGPLPRGFSQPTASELSQMNQGASETSGLAIATLVMGILDIFIGLLFLPTLICGLIALSNIRNSNGRLGGRGMAIAGLLLACVRFVLGMIFLGLIVGGIFGARHFVPPMPR